MKRTNGGQARSALDVWSATAMIVRAVQRYKGQTDASVEEATAEKI
jgi:hypothetical protein